MAQVLRDQGVALDEITIVKAIDAIRKQDFDRGIALARQVFPDDFDQLLRSSDPRPDSTCPPDGVTRPARNSDAPWS